MADSERRLAIGFHRKPDGSRWIYADLLQWKPQDRYPRLIPTLEDIARLLDAIGICEEEKYPPPKQKGRRFFADFVEACALGGRPYAEIVSRFSIKARTATVTAPDVKRIERELTEGDIPW